MNSVLFRGEVMHARHAPVRHTFRYPVYYYGFDLAELDRLAETLPVFGHNRPRVVSLWDRDYLRPGEGDLRGKLESELAAAGLPRPDRVLLVTGARLFGYVFNPASFFFGFDGGELSSVLLQVNNTFGETHLYPLALARGEDGAYRSATAKVFHVSPFFPRDGRYEFAFADPRKKLDILIRYLRPDVQTFSARLTADPVPLDLRRWVATVARQPLAASVTYPRIVRQAAALHFRRKLPVFHKPPPASHLTVRVHPPGLLDRAGSRVLSSFLKRMKAGRLVLARPDGTREAFGESTGPEAGLRVREWRFFRRVLLGGETGLGESFSAGEWDAEDPAAVLGLLARNVDALDDRGLVWAAAGRTFDSVLHLTRSNTPAGSRRNIRAHYDLPPEFFRLFLDPTMTYSCALWERGDQTLEEAQRAKIRAMVSRAHLAPGQRILEIGCGWGSFALEAGRMGCRVTALTVSPEQHAFTRRRVDEAGLSDRVEVLLSDYRHAQGEFDRIVSVEMLEAVGHRYLGAFFAACDRLLAPGGIVALQVITIPDQRYDAYRKGSDWIRKHIFPGGHLPSLTALAEAMTGASRLTVEALENIGPHYARTLREWRRNLLARKAELSLLGFEEAFLRKWVYYFAYCEAGFAERILNDLQLTLSRPGNLSLPCCPGA